MMRDCFVQRVIDQGGFTGAGNTGNAHQRPHRQIEPDILQIVSAGALDRKDFPQIDLAALPPGDWSLLAIHDANQNGKLDTLMGIPREGFAFSRNPVVRFGPPRLEQVRFALPEGDSRQALTMKYLL